MKVVMRWWCNDESSHKSLRVVINRSTNNKYFLAQEEAREKENPWLLEMIKDCFLACLPFNRLTCILIWSKETMRELIVQCQSPLFFIVKKKIINIFIIISSSSSSSSSSSTKTTIHVYQRSRLVQASLARFTSSHVGSACWPC